MSRSGPAAMIPFNPFDRHARPNPYPVYQYMRSVEPIHRSEVGYWILTRYDDCKAVLEDVRWSHDADRILEPRREELAPVDPTVRLLRASIAFSDPPGHDQHRQALEPAMRTAMKGSTTRVRTVAEGLIRLMREHEPEGDLIRDYAAPLSLVVVTDLLGIPAADRAQLQRWARELASGLDPAVRAASITRAGAAAAAMAEYLLGRIEAARDGTSSAGLIGDLAAKPRGLKAWELIGDIAAFLVTGLETTSGLIGNAMLALTQSPDQHARLRSEPSLINSALEEFVRFDGPLHLTARVANEDIELGGIRVAAGEQAIVLLAAANRDPSHFTDPDRLELARASNDHLGFGLGAHACFAAPLARHVCGSAINALVGALDGIELAGDPAWNDRVTMRGLSSLPVKFRG